MPIDVYTDQEEVAHMFREYGWMSALVVDNKGRLIGVINIDDVADIIDVRAEDEFARVELLVSLKQELERLSPREIMIIRTYLDYPIEVVARKLKVRPNTISKTRRKIARELRKKLV